MRNDSNIKINRRTIVNIICAAVAFRLVVYVISFVGMTLFSSAYTLTFSDFFNNWNRWDGPHYLNIALNGYAGATEFCDTCKAALLNAGISANVLENGVHLFLTFYPLFPWLIRLLHVFVSSPILCAMIISTACYAAGCVYTYLLIRLDYSETVARNTVILLSLFPFSFFFGSVHTESLFLFVTAAALYYIRSHRWGMAILFGSLATMTRSQGLLIGLAAGVEWLMQYRPWDMIKNKNFQKMGAFLLRGLSLFLMLSGYLVYLLINYTVDGYAFSYVIYQKSHWGMSAQVPWKVVTYLWKNATSAQIDPASRIAMWIPEFLILPLSIILFVYGIKKLRAFHMAYGISYMLLTYSLSWLISGGRYTVCCIPLFLAMALAAEKRRWLMPALACTGAMLQAVYLTGYLTGKIIM